jgi:hypothetical protein
MRSDVVVIACVGSFGFDLLYAFVIVRLDRRDLVWINVTRNPTAEWVARQITEAFPWDGAPGCPETLVRWHRAGFCRYWRSVVALCISVVSFPLMHDRHDSAADAITTSFRAVAQNPVPMAAWGLIVAVLLLLGSMPLRCDPAARPFHLASLSQGGRAQSETCRRGDQIRMPFAAVHEAAHGTFADGP